MIDAGVEVDRDLPSDQGVNDASIVVDMLLPDADVEPMFDD